MVSEWLLPCTHSYEQGLVLDPYVIYKSWLLGVLVEYQHATMLHTIIVCGCAIISFCNVRTIFRLRLRRGSPLACRVIML